MALTLGARLGTYEILGALGAGGMGEVYRARDTKLGRDAALTANDQVKVLDFGLAKMLDPVVGRGFSRAGTAEAAPYDGDGANVDGANVGRPFRGADAANSPTITTPAMMTGVGTILGTAAYMSPEQAKGREADKRSDVWAFGCVLFEMLTGTRAFEGEDVSDTLAAVLRGEPNWKALPRVVPAHVRTILTRCLEKNRQARFADISTVKFLL